MTGVTEWTGRRFWVRWNHGRLWHGFAVYAWTTGNPLIAYGRAGDLRHLVIGSKTIFLPENL